MKFRTTLELGGKTATGFRVPAEVVETLASGKKPLVNVTINGYTYRTSVMPRGDAFMVPVSSENRGGAGIEADDEIDVEMSLDTEPRLVEVPEDLARALEQDAVAKAFFERLSNSHKRSYTGWIESAKTDETRERRVTQAIPLLREGRKQR